MPKRRSHQGNPNAGTWGVRRADGMVLRPGGGVSEDRARRFAAALNRLPGESSSGLWTPFDSAGRAVRRL